MQYTTLGISGPKVSRVALGCMSTVSNATYDGIADAEGIATIRTVAERLGETMADVSLAWVLQQPGVASVLVGASRADQVARNAAAVTVTLSDADLTELNHATAATRAALGPSLDLWATPSRVR